MTEPYEAMPGKPPFDETRLEAGLRRLGADLVIATSRHNVRYLLGGYECLFFSQMDAIGTSRYSPAVAYLGGDPSATLFIASPLDAPELLVDPVWAPDVRTVSFSTSQTADRLVAWLKERRLDRATIAIEKAFISHDLVERLAAGVPEARLVDATVILEDLRSVKSARELALIEQASEGVVGAMLATFERAQPGMTTREIAAILGAEERARGLHVDYLLVGPGRSMNRTPSSSRLEPGDTLNLDSGGNVSGYIGDLARMAIAGEPSPVQERMLSQIDAVQQAARGPIRAGATGRAIYEAVAGIQGELEFGHLMDFIAHGMGLVSHEAPRLATGKGNPIGYAADHLDRPLEAGMVMSIETTVLNREVGWVKLEDTVVVTGSGCRALGDAGRGWNRIGAAR